MQNSKRSENDYASRNDGNTIVILPKTELYSVCSDEAPRIPKPGEYVAVEVIMRYLNIDS